MNNKNPITIYIVDDNKLFAMALKADIENTFENTPVRIHTFETGEKCMERFKRDLPQLVILDYHLNTRNPGAADGLEVLGWMKTINHHTNVIMLTGEDNIDIAVKLLEHGACDYIVKTETQFKKINYSLLNMFKIIEVNRYERKYKQSIIGFYICIGLLVLSGIAVLVNNYIMITQ